MLLVTLTKFTIFDIVNEFVESNSTMLLNWCLKITKGNREDAKELFQQSVLILLESKNVTHPKAYFYRTAYHIYNGMGDRLKTFNKSLPINEDLLQNNDQDSTQNNKLEAVINVINSCRDCEDIRIFEKFLKYGSLQKVANEEGKHITTIHKFVKRVKQRAIDEYNRLNSNPDIGNRDMGISGRG